MAREGCAANIRKFNADREQRNIALVQQELQQCHRRKLQFKRPGLMAAYLSDQTGIHRTTLLRNAKYRVLLTRYLGSQSGAAAVVADDTDDPWVLKSKLAIAQAELGTLRQETKRLTAQLSRVTATLPAASHSGGDDVEFANLCVLLCLVLVRAETFAVDAKAGSLVDLAARPVDRLVGGSERAAAFVAWMGKNASLPFVKGIKRT